MSDSDEEREVQKYGQGIQALTTGNNNTREQWLRNATSGLEGQTEDHVATSKHSQHNAGPSRGTCAYAQNKILLLVCLHSCI